VGHTGIENDEFTLQAALKLCASGYVVVVPFIFHWWDKDADIGVKRDQSRDDWMVADVTAAHNVLLERGDVSRVGILGHCWGGRVAWLGACHLRGLHACGIFYGGRIKLPMGEGNPPPIDLADQIECPVAGFFGNDDQNPSPADVDDYEAALVRAGVHCTIHRYDGAGHAFQNFPSPERYRPEVSEAAWRELLTFLAGTLGN
jgi:carboxymethylenebutenolidase